MKCPKCNIGEIQFFPKKNRKGQFGRCSNCGRLVNGGKAENKETSGGEKKLSAKAAGKPAGKQSPPPAGGTGRKRRAAKRPVRNRERVPVEQSEQPKRGSILGAIGRFFGSDL